MTNMLFSRPVMSNSLGLHGLQHARPPCPSWFPEVFPSSCPLHQWCHPDISSSDALFSFCPQSFPALRTFQMSLLFASDDQNIGVSASASISPSKEYWGLTTLKVDWFDLLAKGLSGDFSSTTVQRHQFFGALPSLQSSSHNWIWSLERP